MQLFLTSVLPFLAHEHASAAAFLTCRHHNFHSSIIPEFLSDEERVKMVCEARQQKQLRTRSNHDDYYTTINMQYSNLYHLFVQTPLMQFSPSLVFRQKDCIESILKPLLATKYFSRSLQRCVVLNCVNSGLLLGLSKVQTLTNLDLCESEVQNEHLEIIVNLFPSLATLAIGPGSKGRINSIYSKTALFITSPPPPATKTLRSLTMRNVDPLFATRFVSIFSNLRKLNLRGPLSRQELDLLPLSSSLPLLTDLSLGTFILKNTESLKNLVHLSSLAFSSCRMPDSLSFLAQENNLPHLSTLLVRNISKLSFASLSNASNLHVLQLTYCDNFDNDCLQYLENMVHLRKLDLTRSNIVGDSRLFKALMQNLFQLEELNLSLCDIGNKGAIAGTLYSTHSRLRVLNLSECILVDDDLNGIGSLKNTLEVLDLSNNYGLTTEALMQCDHLVKLRTLVLHGCEGITELSPLKDCVDLEYLDLVCCLRLTDHSFKIFSRLPNSFPKLQDLTLSYCRGLTGKVFEHLSRNNHLVYHLKELDVEGLSISNIFLSSPAARNSFYQLKGLRRLSGFPSCCRPMSEETTIEGELLRNLKNLENICFSDGDV